MPEVASGELPGNLKGMTTSGWSGFAPVFDGSALAPPTRVHTMIAEKTLTIVPRRAVRIATQRMSGCGKEEARVVRVRVHVIHETLIHVTAECQGQHYAPTVPWTRCRPRCGRCTTRREEFDHCGLRSEPLPRCAHVGYVSPMTAAKVIDEIKHL